MGVPWYERKTRTFTCGKCSWTGLGSELELEEYYSESKIVDWACPNCHEHLTFSPSPTHEETQAAADAGDQDAIKEPPGIDRARQRWCRVLETRGSDVAAPAELDQVT
jgi:hypothetical protein